MPTLHRSCRLLAFGSLLAAMCGAPALADSAAPGELQGNGFEGAPCIGYDPQSDSWGSRGIGEQLTPRNCPAGSAFVGTTMPRRRRKSERGSAVEGFCCPLPQGALIEQHSLHPTLCPDGAVATGALEVEELDPSSGEKATRFLLRCTTVNKIDFEILPPEEGRQVAVAKQYYRAASRKVLPQVFGNPELALNWNSIPVRIRYALGRVNYDFWVTEFCVGAPPGSLLSASGSSCSEQQYRQLVRRHRDATQDSTPCLAIDNLFSPNARCLVEAKERQ